MEKIVSTEMHLENKHFFKSLFNTFCNIYIYIYIYMYKINHSTQNKSLSTWCFEHSGGISCSLLVNVSHTGESWAG